MTSAGADTSDRDLNPDGIAGKSHRRAVRCGTGCFCFAMQSPQGLRARHRRPQGVARKLSTTPPLFGNLPRLRSGRETKVKSSRRRRRAPCRAGRIGWRACRAGHRLGPGRLPPKPVRYINPYPAGGADRHAVAPLLRQDDGAHGPAMDRREPRRRGRQSRHGGAREVGAGRLHARPGRHRGPRHLADALRQAAVQPAHRLHLRLDDLVAAQPAGGQPRASRPSRSPS